uniref:DNA mismatch repair protein MutS n=1 Tax=uncultured Alphaproteobacteria bacterium TaxID=91750 RepID=A0A6G8F2L8_9PROT|nr:DNA mismatch repair protein MutS [uncultured Alphaproteobacteria bacterium]
MTDEKKASGMTPMLEQYFETRKAYPGYLLFYRMGDFYEMFFEDAVAASKALDITLTKRGQYNGEDIPMCGVPFHAYEAYLSRLIKQGYKVAICEQMENPAEAKKRGYKSVVKRDVIRLVTAGTLTEDNLLDTRKNNFLLAISKIGDSLGASWLDLSTGDFYTENIIISGKSEKTQLSGLLARLNPVEILLPDSYLQNQQMYELFAEYRSQLSPLPQARFNSENAKRNLLNVFKVESLEVFGSFSRAEITSAGVLIDYIETTQKGRMPKIEKPVKVFEHQVMEIDGATRRSLELVESASSIRNSSLLGVMDRTVTGVGARMLASRIAAPLLDVDEINQRLDVVSFFIDEEFIRQDVRSLLKGCPDVERAVSRLSLGRGGPRDMSAVKCVLEVLPKLKNIISGLHQNTVKELPSAVSDIIGKFGNHDNLVDEIGRALTTDDLPLLTRDGDFIAAGYYPPLDELRNLKSNSKQVILQMQEKYAAETGISNLKIKYNNVIGYFVEVPVKFATEMLENKKFIHRQSVLNAVRFTTVELTEIENEIRGASEKALAIELQLFDNLVDLVKASSEDISRTAKAVAELDVGAALADLAAEKNYCRPLVDNSLDFEIREGRHPVVEASLDAEHSGAFVGNNCLLGGENSSIWLITGPNMAGKSTFLRQNALIAVMAQAGAYVPASSAHIGVVSKLFSRVGASDDLARGRSTFMVEMVETAGILNQADERSLVILDEIGRGTATFDGLSIAWAVVEHLHEVNRSRALFATHYHELTSLVGKLHKMTLHCMKIKEFNDEVIFLHEVIDGAADRSYGIHVAKLAGLPSVVVKRAEQVLSSLENDKKSGNIKELADDLPLFASLREQEKAENVKSPAQLALEALNPDNLSPREALEELYKLKEMLK